MMKSTLKKGSTEVVKVKAALLRSMLAAAVPVLVIDPKADAQGAYQEKLQASSRAVLAYLTRSGAR